MTPDSFTFGIINLYDKYGIKCIKRDVLSPQKRRNTLQIPKRNGSYNQGGKYYDDRAISIECQLVRNLTALDIREIAYDLSNRKNLAFWDEPALHYDAELYDPAEVEIWPQYKGANFQIQFIAAPFAMSQRIIKPVKLGRNLLPVDGLSVYRGTYEAPCVIELVNTSATNVQTVKITAIKRSVV